MHVWNVLHAPCWKFRTQKLRQKSPSAHHRTSFSGYIFAIKAHVNNRKKSLLNSNISSTCPYNMVNFSSLAAEIDWWVSPLGFVTAQRRSTKLCTVFGRLLGWYTMYSFGGFMSPNGILPVAKFTLCSSLVFCYISSVTARHSSTGR